MISFSVPNIQAGAILIVLALTCSGAVCLRPDSTVPPAQADQFAPVVAQTTSSTVSLGWPRVKGMKQVRVYLAPAPIKTEGGKLEDEALLATLDASSSGHRVQQLVPGVHHFFRVEMEVDGRNVSQVLHARTQGGLFVPMDSPVRSAHLLAPDVLMVVLREGEGSRWAKGPWKLRAAQGKRVRVEKVHRQTVPVGQPSYELGFGADNDIEDVSLEHRIYLRLRAPLGNRATLRVTGPQDLQFVLPYSDRYLETPVVQLNQVGYDPEATQRWAYVSWWMGDGGGLSLDFLPATVEAWKVPSRRSAQRQRTNLRLEVAARNEDDIDAGTEVAQVDLAPLAESAGAFYRLRIPGVGVSYPTRVSDRATFKSFFVTARGLFHNRWGGDLKPELTEWSRPADHPTVFTSEHNEPLTMPPESMPKAGERPLQGGYHDAGDFDQRPSHTVVPELLMRAYELRPKAFVDGQLMIPESGNGIPDLLDEALWGVQAWAQLQEKSGGVRAGVESHRHPWGIYFAHEDPLPYWTFAVNADVTGRAAGLFAQASRLIKPFDAKRAGALKKRAVHALAYATNHDAQPAFLLYAASELYRLTGEATYKQRFETLWNSFGRDGIFSAYALEHLALGDYVKHGRVMADYVLGYLTAPGASPVLREQALKWFGNYADMVADRIVDSSIAHRNARPPDRAQFGWGQTTVMGRYLDPIYARMQLGGLDEAKRQHYLDALSISADYVLGANPLGMVYLTGLGEIGPREPLHLDSLAWMKKGKPPVPGIPVYGPVSGLPNAHYYEPGKKAFYPAFDRLPPMRRYADLRTFVVNTEFSVWESQAPHTLHFAMLAPAEYRPPKSWRPKATKSD